MIYLDSLLRPLAFQSPRVTLPRHIRRQGEGLAAALSYLASGLLEFLLMASAEHHAAALGGESGGNRFPMPLLADSVHYASQRKKHLTLRGGRSSVRAADSLTGTVHLLPPACGTHVLGPYLIN